MSRPTDRTSHGLVTALWVSAALIGLAGAALTAVAWGDLKPEDSFSNLASAFAGILYAALGALIVRRVRNIVGWILLGVGSGMVVLSSTSAYAVVGVLTHPGALPAPRFVGAVGEPVFAALAIALGFMLFVFPTGTLPSVRWRPILRIGLVGAAVTVLGFIFLPAQEKLAAPGGVSLVYPNPVRIRSFALSTVLVGAVWVVVLAVAIAFLSLVVRYRSGESEQRQQIKWVAFAAASALVLNVAALLSLAACGCDRSSLGNAFLLLEGFVVLIGVPAAIAIAILKHGLYEIDVIMNRAVVYGVLAAGLTIVYVGLVAGVGTLVGDRGSPALTIAAAVAIALVFQPLRLRAQRYDLAIDFHGGPRASLLAWLSGARRRVGYAVRGRSWMYTTQVPRPRAIRPLHKLLQQRFLDRHRPPT